MSPQGSHHSSRFLQGHRRTNKPPLVRLLETRRRANGSLKETPRRQRLACIQPGNYTRAPSITIKQPPWLRGVGLLRGVFSRGDTVTNRVLSVLQGSLGKKLTPDGNIKAPNNQGAKEERKPPQKPMCTYSTKPKLRATSALMTDVALLKMAQYQVIAPSAKMGKQGAVCSGAAPPGGFRHPKTATCAVSARRLQSRPCRAPARNRSSAHTRFTNMTEQEKTQTSESV